ncbi:hypothetical protein ACFFOM_02795 [Microlunatus capsulatus]|uniref:Transposase DDE domain-containing protein n=1 Tax=Microlunatus capsulatus TaxID=99117 RepID=A0ABS4Z2R7_9ACTN|nr:hypothetical protein [Microlunatus capsulatus]MBP2415346.1 hypothetical protein [Microlunatus capsulatus]
MHVLVDLTGVTLAGNAGSTQPAGSPAQRKAARTDRTTRFFEVDQQR